MTAKRYILTGIMTLMMLSMASISHAQPLRNTAFRGGETLTYNLYYNWAFVWVKAGSATMTITEQPYRGQQAYRCALTTRGSDRADKYFVLRDTLLCYTTTDLMPLYFRKGAREGKRYYVDELFYTYPGKRCHVTMKALHNDGTRTTEEASSQQNIYDMISIFLRARSFSAVGWKKGHTITFPIADGNGTKNAKLRYNGTTNIKADNGKKYPCLSLSYLEPNGKKDKEIVRFYVTDDQHHVPIRLDLFLKFGSAKAFLKTMKL